MRYSEGVITELTDGSVDSPQLPVINNAGQIAWQYHDSDGGPKAIHLWENGTYRVFTNWGMNVRLNDAGDMYFIRWYQSSQTYQAWLYRAGQFFQLSNDPFWNTDGDINERGEIAWKSRGSPEGDVRYLERLPTGDMNCDGSANAFDIDPFLLALSDPDGYGNAHPQCDLLLGDGNGDGSVNAFDIQPFIELLGG